MSQDELKQHCRHQTAECSQKETRLSEKQLIMSCGYFRVVKRYLAAHEGSVERSFVGKETYPRLYIEGPEQYTEPQEEETLEWDDFDETA